MDQADPMEEQRDRRRGGALAPDFSPVPPALDSSHGLWD
jgi:hypothetical protein